MANLNIYLNDQNNSVYFAGQILHGTAEVTLPSAKDINGFFVVIKGIAKCNWTEKEQRSVGTGNDRRSESRTVYFEGKDVYLNSKVSLFPRGTMPSGTHRYDFQCVLPMQVPASYEAKHGSIRYEIEAKLDIPWGFDKEIKRQFTVARVEDLNMYPDLLCAVKHEEIKRFCCLFCASDPCIVTVTLPRSGFVPGEFLNFQLEFHNNSNTDIFETRVVLRRTLTYVSDTPHSKIIHESEALVRKSMNGVKAKSKSSSEGQVEIPRILVPSNSRYCRVVQISYELEIEAVSDGCHQNIKLISPITIGSVPLNPAILNAHSQVPVAPPMQIPQIPIIQPMAPQNFMPPMPYSEGQYFDAPPTFEEAMKPQQQTFNKESENNFGWKNDVSNGPPSAPSAPLMP